MKVWKNNVILITHEYNRVIIETPLPLDKVIFCLVAIGQISKKYDAVNLLNWWTKCCTVFSQNPFDPVQCCRHP